MELASRRRVSRVQVHSTSPQERSHLPLNPENTAAGNSVIYSIPEARTRAAGRTKLEIRGVFPFPSIDIKTPFLLPTSQHFDPDMVEP